jgi:hypothetical protein
MVQLYVRKNHARPQMRAMTQNRISDIVEMRDLRVIEEDAILELTRIPHHHAVPDDHILPHVTSAADLAILPDPRRAF